MLLLIYQIGSNYGIKPENGQLACLSVVYFLGGGGGSGVRVGHVRSRRSFEHEFKRLVLLMLPTSSNCKF